jgi:uncharacterized protein (DUF1015 family)
VSDPKKRLVNLLRQKTSKRPLEHFVDYYGVKTRLWICQNPTDVQLFQEAVRDEDFLIADGHHRYETALSYQAEMRSALGKRHKNMPFDYTMMYLTSMADEGLVILPTHRALTADLGAGVDINEVLGDLEGYFDVETVEVNREDAAKSAAFLLEQITPDRNKRVRMAMILRNQPARILTLKAGIDLDKVIALEDLPAAVRELDVSILHNFIIRQIWIGNPEMEIDETDIIYTREAAEVIERVRQRHACVGFLVNAPRIEQARAVAEQGLRMPQKSTYFYPKIASGIVMRDISRHH